MTLIRSRPHGKGILGRNKTGPVLYLGDTQKSASQWSDISGHGNHGIVYGAGTPPAATPGALGYILDGVDDYVNLGTTANLGLSGAGSISFWLNYRNTGSVPDRLLMAKRDGTGTNYQLSIVPGNGNVFASYSGAPQQKSSYVVPTNQWVHLALVRTAVNTSVLYANGVSVYTFSLDWGAGTSALLGIGGNPSVGSYYIGALIDEVRIFNRALSATEIKRLYERTRILFGV